MVDFIIWKIPDHRYSAVLYDVARITLDIYAGVIGLSDKLDGKLFKELKQIVEEQEELTKGLLELSGQIDMITRVASIRSMVTDGKKKIK